ISKQRLTTGTPKMFHGTSLTRPPIARQSLSAKEISGSLDSDIIIKIPTSSEQVFKIPATLKAKEHSLVITTTSEKRAVQVQQKEDPFKNFVEVEAPAHIFLTGDQYYARDTILGKYMILNQESLKTKITEPVSTVAAAIVMSTAKIPSKTSKPFGSLPKDLWEPDKNTAKKLQEEVSVLLCKHGAADGRYQRKKKELEREIKN
ncbi:MAG: hypothetical protein GY861_29205, partial [bacterium]|nr:hypothetical protein [bacterium]